jgi:hypothetical protein
MDQEATLDKFDRLWDATSDHTRVQRESEEQYERETKQFSSELRSVIGKKQELIDASEWLRRVDLPSETVFEILTGKRVPREGVLLSILKAAGVSKRDTERLLDHASELRDWKRRLDTKRAER